MIECRRGMTPAHKGASAMRRAAFIIGFVFGALIVIIGCANVATTWANELAQRTAERTTLPGMNR